MSLLVRSQRKYIRISAQKVRLLIDIVRGMPAIDAVDMLEHMPQSCRARSSQDHSSRR